MLDRARTVKARKRGSSLLFSSNSEVGNCPPESQNSQSRPTARSISYRTNRLRGFSLIELLISIVVMGIMVAATILRRLHPERIVSLGGTRS
jgi:prepilin-type N-terminal cleavage/methylation domain-containing protein